MDINDQSVEDILTVLDYLKSNTSINNTHLKTIYDRAGIIIDQQERLHDNMHNSLRFLQKSLYDVVKYTHRSSLDLSSMRNTLHKFYLSTDRNLFKLLLAHKEGRQTWKEFQSFYEESQKTEIQQAAKQEKQTISKFKALTTSILTKQDFVEYDTRKTKRERIDANYRSLSKYEKQTLKEQQLLNSKMGELVKGVKTEKKPEGSGLMKILNPFILLFGGIAALSYGMMKFPLVRRMLTDLKGSRLGSTLAGFVNKIKPQDKTIKEWLRGLPFIGNLFDIYDGFQELFKGNIKQGIKHFAFALPGADWLATMIGSSKQEMLKPGGLQKAWQGFSLQKTWQNIKSYFSDTFLKPITDIYYKIADAFTIMSGGSRGNIVTGLWLLGEDFPAIKPIASFVSKMVGKVFDFTLGSLDIEKPEDWPEFKEQTMSGVFNSIYEGISGFMTKIMDVFGQIGTFIGHFANIFSDDYSKQSAALNAIDDMSPSIGGMLRTVLGLVDNFKNAGIAEGDNAIDVITKLTKAATKGSGQSKFGRAQTLTGEMAGITAEAKGLDKEKDQERLKALSERQKVLAYQSEVLRNRERVAFEKSQREKLNLHLQQPGSGYGLGMDAALGYGGSAALLNVPGIGPYLAAGGAALTTGGLVGKGLKAVGTDLWNRGEYQNLIDQGVAREREAKKNMYEQWMKVGREVGEAPPEEIIDLIKQDINAGLLSPSVLQPKKKNIQLPEPAATASVSVNAPPAAVPQAPKASDRSIEDIMKDFHALQEKQSQANKVLPDIHLLLERAFPIIEEIRNATRTTSEKPASFLNVRGAPVINNYGALGGSNMPTGRGAFATP